MNIDWNDWIEEEEEEIDILTDEKFVNFLEENNAYDKFIYNIKYISYLDFECLKTYCNDTIKHNYLYYSFNWAKTSEGFDFWEKLNIKWLKIY
jgi:hypothetical protein